MALSWWKPCAGISLLIGAYVAGTYHPRADLTSAAPGGKESPAREATSIHGSEDPAAKLDRVSLQNLGMGFKPAAPFGPGGARDWFIATTRVNHDDSFTGFLQLVQNCTTLDERSALELAEELRDILKLYQDGDPTLRSLFKGDDIQERSLAATIFRLSQLNPEAAIRFMDESPDLRQKGEIYEMIFANYALKDPVKAGEALQKLDAGQLRGSLEGAMATLSGKDPDAAYQLLSRFDGAGQDNERRKLVERVVKQDPEKAVAFAEDMVKSGRTPEVFASLASEWLKKDAAAASAWAASYHGPGEVGVKDVLIRHSAESDPQKAAKDFSALGAQASDLANTAHVIGRKLAQADLTTATDWLASLPEGKGRAAAESEIVDVWLAKDPLEAAAWIREMPAGESRDGVSVRLIRSITRRHPQEALEWAGSLQDSAARTRMQQDVLKDWREQDPEAAGEAAKRLGIP
ncbi:hypothetical protein [Luteolibacter luteus]|uniref:Uncharacterized protein n=1 Tax=Luteolibacter luteus TaxID=2728835 RepID=A0A858RDU3_9BACT|nr:hypothetical protein [Luteolibacter luteus]QJE94744.1 hypothetical protein HHL09_02755 [Luteolibacter luteus]